jgi:hypothetical protein
MKLTICGSNAFKEKMLEYKKLLEERGHVVFVHPDYEAFIRGEKQELWRSIQNGEHAKAKKEQGYIKWYYDAIVGSDGILVLNFEKKGVPNYIGGNTLMEIAFAYVNDKKVFLLNPVPEMPYKDEILAMYTKVLDGNLRAIEG